MNYAIMILRKINFDILLIFCNISATLYLSIFIWASDFLKFVFMNVVILIFYKPIILKECHFLVKFKMTILFCILFYIFNLEDWTINILWYMLNSLLNKFSLTYLFLHSITEGSKRTHLHLYKFENSFRK